MSYVVKLLSSRVLLAIIYVLLWPPFLLLATYTSHDASMFGLWSRRLFMVVVAYGLLLLAASIAALRAVLTSSKLPDEPPKWLNWVRQRKVVFVGVTSFPVCLWLLAVAAIVMIGPAPQLAARLTWALADLALVVIALEALLLLAGRDARERRSIAIRLSAVGTGLLVSIVLIEIGGRIYPIEPQNRLLLNPPNLNVRFRTIEFDTRVTTNEQGLRENIVVRDEHPGKLRVVVIGDSMTFGQGVSDDELFPRVAEKLLHETHDMPDVELVNLSRRGAGPGEYLQYVRYAAERLNPDLIVIAYYTGNDCPVRQPYVPRTPEQLAKLKEDILREGQSHLAMQSVVCRLAYRRALLPLDNWRRTASARATPGVPDPVFNAPNSLGQLISSAKLGDVERQRLQDLTNDGWIDKGLRWDINPALIEAAIVRPTGIADMMYLRDETRAAMRREWQLCEEVLAEIVETAREHATKIHVLIIPHVYQVDERAVAQLREWQCDAPTEMLDSRVQNDLVKQFCERHNVQFVEPLGRFRAETAAGQKLFFPIDSHCTPEGHRLLAELLAEHLAQQIVRDVQVTK